MAKATVLVHGHRGARMIYPENTISAFKYAAEIGVDFLELDLHLTKDHQLIVHHDPKIPKKRCQINGSELEVEPLVYQLSIGEVQKYDCGSKIYKVGDLRVPKNLVEGERIPRLEDVLALSSLYPKLKFNIELKYDSKEKGEYPERTLLVDEFFKRISDTQLKSKVILQSFDKEILRLARKKDKEIELSYLYMGKKILNGYYIPNWSRAKKFMKEISAQYFSPNYKLMIAFDNWWIGPLNFLKTFKDQEIKVVPWTSNKKEDWNILIDKFNVQGIITDDPKPLVDLLSQN